MDFDRNGELTQTLASALQKSAYLPLPALAPSSPWPVPNSALAPAEPSSGARSESPSFSLEPLSGDDGFPTSSDFRPHYKDSNNDSEFSDVSTASQILAPLPAYPATPWVGASSRKRIREDFSSCSGRESPQDLQSIFRFCKRLGERLGVSDEGISEVCSLMEVRISLLPYNTVDYYSDLSLLSVCLSVCLSI